MSNCLENTAVVGCYDNGGVKTPVVIHYIYDNILEPAVLITDTAGVPVAGADATNTTAGACEFGTNPNVSLISDGAQIAGATRALTTPFIGANNSWTSSSVPDKLHSITISARGVTDGLPGQVTNQIMIVLPTGTKFNLMDGETRTFSVERDQDYELKREFEIYADGNAYANITFTYFS